MLHYGLFTWKGNCYCSFTDVFIAVAMNIYNKVSFNMEWFKNFPSFSPILFTISWALLTLYTLTSVCYSPHCSQYISLCAGRENLLNNQEVLQLIIIAFILITLMFDSGWYWKGKLDATHYQRLNGEREKVIKKCNFDSSKYLNMWVTFDVFTCNRMIKLKMASKRSELPCNNWVTTFETWALGKYTLTCNSDDYSLLR